jgi:hypothetical protein
MANMKSLAVFLLIGVTAVTHTSGAAALAVGPTATPNNSAALSIHRDWTKTCQLITNPGRYEGAESKIDVGFYVTNFDGSAIIALGCSGLMRMAALPADGACAQLDDLLSVPGHRPGGDVYAKLTGTVARDRDGQPFFKVRECSTIELTPIKGKAANQYLPPIP